MLHFLRPRNIYQCALPLSCIHFITSCSGIWYYRGRFITNKWLQLYGIASATFNSCSMWFIIYVLLTDQVESSRLRGMDPLLKFICGFELLISTLFLLVIVIFMQRHAEQHVRLYDRIQELDNRLISDFGANLSYQKLLRKNIVEVTVIIGVSSLVLNSTIWYMAPERFLIAGIALAFYLSSTSGPNCTFYMHMNFAEMLRVRFRLLQRLLDPEYIRGKFPEEDLQERQLQFLIDTVRKFHVIILDLNVVYRSSLVVTISHDLLLVTVVLYFLFGHSMGTAVSLPVWIFGFVWLLQPFYKLVTGPVLCGRTIKEGRKCLRLIEHIDFSFPQLQRVKGLVASTMYWRLEENVQFICGSGFVCNTAILSTATAIILNYLLILIQFRMTQIMGQQIEDQKDILQDWIGEA